VTKSTKIVATIGPATANATNLNMLAAAGMDVARLNGSHATLAWHSETIALIRRVLPKTPIILDIPGRKIRTMDMAQDYAFQAGETITFTTDPDGEGGNKIRVSSSLLHAQLSHDDTIFADDGTLRFLVLKTTGRDIVCQAEGPGKIRDRMGINVPNVELEGDVISESDQQMIELARKEAVEFVGVSFVVSAEHVAKVRDIVGADFPKILAKIENQRGLDAVEEIVEAADAVMIDRGDLSVETDLKTVALFQKRILDVARRGGKPAIVATEMLHSMISNPFPTKAEISDITNAVVDGCAAMMLSGETAIGRYPIEAVSIMRDIAEATETHVHDLVDTENARLQTKIPQVMGAAIALISRSLPVTKIVAITRSGYAARTIAAERPRAPILAVSDSAAAARSFGLLPGVEGIHTSVVFSRASTDHIAACLKELWLCRRIGPDDLILVNALSYPKSGNRMNLLQTHYVSDLAEALGWQDVDAVGDS